MQSATLAKTKVSNLVSKSILLLTLVLSAFGVLAVFAPQADAMSTYVWDNRRTVGVVPLEYGPTDYGNPYYWMTEGTRFKMKCFRWGKGMTGNYYSSMWLYGQEYSRGSWGYVHSSYVFQQTSVPHC